MDYAFSCIEPADKSLDCRSGRWDAVGCWYGQRIRSCTDEFENALFRGGEDCVAEASVCFERRIDSVDVKLLMAQVRASKIFVSNVNVLYICYRTDRVRSGPALKPRSPTLILA